MPLDLPGIHEPRIHVGAVGFDELTRLLDPLKQMRADAFVLLEQEGTDDALVRYVDADQPVMPTLEGLGLAGLDNREANLWQAASVANLLGRMMQDEGYARLHINVGTGPKTVGLGATIASLFWPISLYYPEVDYGAKKTKVWGYPVKAIQPVPTFRTRLPRQEVMQTLQILNDRSGPVSQAVLRKELVDQEVISAKRLKPNKKFTRQAKDSQFRNLLRPLLDMRLVDASDKTTAKLYTITDSGVATLESLAGIDLTVDA